MKEFIFIYNSLSDSGVSRGKGDFPPPPKPQKICKAWGTTQASEKNLLYEKFWKFSKNLYKICNKNSLKLFRNNILKI